MLRPVAAIAAVCIAYRLSYAPGDYPDAPGDYPDAPGDYPAPPAASPEPDNAEVRFAKVKMNMRPYFSAMEDHRRASDGAAPPRLMRAPLMAEAPRKVNVAEFDGSADRELPVVNQLMCGSCWAVASSLALKANLNLKELGFLPHEAPNMLHLISCSDRPHQVVNPGNTQNKWIIELGPTRSTNSGCEGGITGMALSMLQAERYVYKDDVRTYSSGSAGDLKPGPVVEMSKYNLPEATCSQALARSPGDRVDLSALDFRHLDTVHLLRRHKSHGVYFPGTRDVRDMLLKNGAVIVFVDIDSGLSAKGLVGKEQATLAPCKWTASDYTQSGGEDMHSTSLFKEADHAMLLTGWSCRRKAWLVQNSWGKEWGVDGKLWLRDDNVCDEGFSLSAHSYGAGPACMFGSTMTVFALKG